MSRAARLHLMTEGQRGSRNDLEEGGRYLGIPQHDVCTSVHDCPKNRVRYRSTRGAERGTGPSTRSKLSLGLSKGGVASQESYRVIVDLGRRHFSKEP